MKKTKQLFICFMLILAMSLGQFSFADFNESNLVQSVDDEFFTQQETLV